VLACSIQWPFGCATQWQGLRVKGVRPLAPSNMPWHCPARSRPGQHLGAGRRCCNTQELTHTHAHPPWLLCAEQARAAPRPCAALLRHTEAHALACTPPMAAVWGAGLNSTVTHGAGGGSRLGGAPGGGAAHGGVSVRSSSMDNMLRHSRDRVCAHKGIWCCGLVSPQRWALQMARCGRNQGARSSAWCGGGWNFRAFGVSSQH